MKSRFKFIPTKKLKEILNSNHCTGIDGADYGPVEEELQAVLLWRQEREDEKALKSFEKEQEEYQDYLDSLQVA